MKFVVHELPEFVEVKTVLGPQASNVLPSAEDARDFQRS